MTDGGCGVPQGNQNNKFKSAVWAAIHHGCAAFFYTAKQRCPAAAFAAVPSQIYEENIRVFSKVE